jgi:hypothetical protein
MNIKGKPKGFKKKTTKLLDYRSWIIEVDNNFPCFNYVVRKKTDTGYHHVAYCGSLESALNQIFQVMLLDTVNKQHDYGGKFKDLQKAILETKNELSDLLDVSSILKNKIKKGDKQNATC